jgi:hypothetical protein
MTDFVSLPSEWRTHVYHNGCKVAISQVDADGIDSLVVFSPERARLVAQALVAAADDVEASCDDDE